MRRRQDGRLNAHVGVVTEFAEGVSVVARMIAPPPVEVSNLITPVADGTRLELVCRWPARMEKSAGKNVAPAIAISLEKTVEKYKALIEEQASGCALEGGQD